MPQFSISILKNEFVKLADLATDQSKTCKKLPTKWATIFQDALIEYYSNSTQQDMAYAVEISGNRSRLYNGKRRAGVPYFNGN